MRPVLERPLVSQTVAWVTWIGLPRLIAVTGSVLLIVAGVWWLLRAPPVPTEQLLPATSGSPPGSTLAVASSAPSAHASTASIPVSVTVHVAGEVSAPGVYQLDVGARVVDAVTAAGGVTAGGDPEALNLAAVVVDGARIYVPALGEVDPASVPADMPAATPSGADSGGLINVNTADASALESLPGVGPATAAAIVEDRERNGPFASVDELDRVPGIGPAKLASLRDLVTT